MLLLNSASRFGWSNVESLHTAFPLLNNKPLSPSAPACWGQGWRCPGTGLSTAPCLQNHQSPEEFSTGHRKGKSMHRMLSAKRNPRCDTGHSNPLALFCFPFQTLKNLCFRCYYLLNSQKLWSRPSPLCSALQYLSSWKDVFISHYPHDTAISHMRELPYSPISTDLGFKLCTQLGTNVGI